ncbi:MAG: hypothetical protein MUO97_11045 [Dehalococcoidia bacterium]|nr:hypothetical protein [Dehalococcoidia bacterium]
MKVVDCEEQSDQPVMDSEDELVRFDVEYLLKCLGLMRDTQYLIIGQPDTSQRNLPQPDYIVKDTHCNLVVIEYARFFESQGNRQKLVQKLKYFNALRGLLNAPGPADLGRRLTEFFDAKLAKGQFASFANCEKILLAKNRWSDAHNNTFIAAERYFNPQRSQDCDHFYLIVRKKLLEVF